jgi:hypothetical protein
MAEIINFLEAKQALAARDAMQRIQEREMKRERHIPEKKALVISTLPGETIPPEYPDFRPFLQRDGLILLLWAVWENYNGEGLHYRINWIKSCGKAMSYADFWTIDSNSDIDKMLAESYPDRRGDFYYKEGRINFLREVADTVFICAPRFNIHTRSLYIEKLKKAGVNINFDFDYNLGYAKELEFKKQMQIIESHEKSCGNASIG